MENANYVTDNVSLFVLATLSQVQLNFRNWVGSYDVHIWILINVPTWSSLKNIYLFILRDKERGRERQGVEESRERG